MQGKNPGDYVFTQASGSPWNQDRLDERFRMVRKLAKVRDQITIYSFRHLWISDMMEDPEIPVGTIASMAGTSIDQIERTYGHFRNRMKAEGSSLDSMSEGHSGEMAVLLRNTYIRFNAIRNENTVPRRCGTSNGKISAYRLLAIR